MNQLTLDTFTLGRPWSGWSVARSHPMRVSHLSLENIRAQVTATKAGVYVSPTADTVQMAFPAEGAAPVSGDWKTATWETSGTVSPTYNALCLVGPGGTVTLAAATYDVWVKVTDSPEVPVKQAGKLTIF